MDRDAERRAVGAEAVLVEWLRAIRGLKLADPVGLRAWAAADPVSFRSAFAAFAGLAETDTALLDAAAGWLLGAAVRPDDIVLWTGDPADPWLAGFAVTGATRTHDPARATRVLDAPIPWP